MRKRLYLIIVLLSVFAFRGNAQLKIDAEFRPRFEVNDGVKTLLTKDQSPAFVTSQRSRLNFGFVEDQTSLYFSIQDCRIWGESVYKKDVPSMAVNEAWAAYSFNENLAIKLGRQVLSYDDKRLLGPSDWGTVGASHDLALLKAKGNNLRMDIGLAYNNDVDKKYESNYPLDFYKYLGFIWINKTFSKKLSLSLMNIADGYQKKGSDDTTYTRFTSGFYCNYQNDSSLLSCSLSAYYQYGDYRDGSSISAYFFSFTPELRFSKSFSTKLGIDYFSGGSEFSSSNKNHAFSKLYGDSHGYYGYMDYFTEIDKDTKGTGLSDIFLSAQWKWSENSSFELGIHNFSINANAIDTISTPGKTLKAKKQLGNEVDLTIKHKLSSSVEIRGGYSIMFATKTMEIFKEGDYKRNQQWAWISFIFKPVLFKGEPKKK